jgi:tRNA threonylcarbamoyladenosine biosynthesis protein TsaE
MIVEIRAGENELYQVCEILEPLVRARKLILLSGEMGSGKTTLVKTLMKKMGVGSSVQSPTYSLVNTYDIGEGPEVYHFDLYRLNRPEEAEEAGIAELLQKNRCRIVEWPERLPSGYYENPVRVSIETTIDERIYRIEG